MKKKILAIIMICLMIFMPVMLSGCNYQLFDFNDTFNRAYVKIGDEWKDLALKSWRDCGGEQLQLILLDGTVMLVCSVNCILYNGRLPE